MKKMFHHGYIVCANFEEKNKEEIKMNRIVEMIEEKERLRKNAERIVKNAPSMRNYGNSPKLCKVGDLIYSYNTCVGVFIWDEEESKWQIAVPRYHSATTTRHINKIAREYNAEVVKLY